MSADLGLDELPAPGRRRTVSARHIPLVVIAPRRLFARVEDVCAYRFTLLLLLTAVTLIGWATVETGLIDRRVDSQVERQIAELEKVQADVVARTELNRLIEEQRKTGEFFRLVTRIQVIVAAPVAMLASILLISAVLYGVVALTGRKPEWHTLMALGIYASFVQVFGMALGLVLMVRHATLDVDTTAGALAQVVPREVFGQAVAAIPPEAMAGVKGVTITPELIQGSLAAMLSGIDPFHIWFWLLMGLGLSVTTQLKGWRMVLVCMLFWMFGAGLRVALAFAGMSQ